MSSITGTSVRRRLLVLILALGVVWALTVALAPDADAASRKHKIQHARKIAVHQIGDPYAYGGAGPHRFDCSGLIYYSTHKAGLRKVPRTSRAQAASMRKIKRKHMRRGDFMYFYNSGGVYHAAVFLGWHNGHRVMVHAARPGTRVHKTRPWTNKWMARTLRR
jgi:cell wall-associated NlpC family hydrolase